MRKVLIIATLAALAVGSAGVSIASAQGRGGGHGGGAGGGNGGGFAATQGSAVTGLDRADAAAGTHGAQGRRIARSHGANRSGFCPPGQAKKSGSGSRFRC
jgi:hypothetical protein